MRGETAPGLPYVEGSRVVCAEHSWDWTATSPAHAGNALVKHLREQHPVELTEVNLTQAALWVLSLRSDPDLQPGYRGALGTWCELLGLDSDAAALAVAEQYAEHPESPVIATVAPF